MHRYQHRRMTISGATIEHARGNDVGTLDGETVAADACTSSCNGGKNGGGEKLSKGIGSGGGGKTDSAAAGLDGCKFLGGLTMGAGGNVPVVFEKCCYKAMESLVDSGT